MMQGPAVGLPPAVVAQVVGPELSGLELLALEPTRSSTHRSCASACACPTDLVLSLLVGHHVASLTAHPPQ